MRVAFAGSRGYPRPAQVGATVRGLPPGTEVASGGGGDVDEAAERAARAFGLKFTGFRVDTVGLPEDEPSRRIEFGKRAYARTTRMVEWADEVYAFWRLCDGPYCKRPRPHVTHGTLHAIREAKRLGKPLTLVGPRGETTR